ncbi:abortive infection family protein [Azospirillum brasilense]|uniref:abortive infection family protein n=1 Tax=Azospirillum brasilense TaxID=192 RepID=UPI002ECFDE43|nr:abortive infection family protein [Azospirillum brasilense]
MTWASIRGLHQGQRPEVATTGRTHGCTRPTVNTNSPLAPRGPSTHGFFDGQRCSPAFGERAVHHINSEHLQLAPDQHTEEVFKTILGNCQNVVNSLASIRNKLSDAHGRGRKAVRPSARHAELAVNLAGTVATFLVSTWRARQASQP